MGDVLIPGLMVGDCADRICVRVCRFWEFFDPQDEKNLLHADLVLIDEEGNSIHAQIYPPAYEQFRPLIKEGRVYNLSCFRVRKSNKKYKPVTNDVMMSLSKWTTTEEVADVPPAFPTFTYALTPIEQIAYRDDYTEYFTDVIGVIASISSVSMLRTRMRQADTSKRVVTIRSASNASVDVVLWGESASSFPAEQMHKDGQTCPQIVMFVGTLIKSYAGTISLSGSSGCRWYINPDIPEARTLMDRAMNMQQAVRWDQQVPPAGPTLNAEPKKISDIKFLNPFTNKKKEFLVTVTVRKIDNSWWYNACKKCLRTAKPHGDTYKCSDPDCATIGGPTQRYKLSVLAGDETGDVDFIIFGRWVQRLTKKTVDTLITENPPGFIPNEITNLLEKIFIWNVSFTQNTIGTGWVCFQVNAIIEEIDSGIAPPVTSTGSQSSPILSQTVASNMQGTIQKFAVLSLASQHSHASSSTSTKKPANITVPPVTPQSATYTPQSEKGAETPLIAPENSPEPTSTSPTLTQSSAVLQEDTDLVVPKEPVHDTPRSSTKKRSRLSPTIKISKKLQFTDEDAAHGSDSPSADAPTDPSAYN